MKAEHKAFDGPPAARLPAIMASTTWTDSMPITAFVIDHPEGLIVVDTGETSAMADPDYAACDPITGLFYRRNLQIAQRAEDELGPLMQRHGLDPARVTQVIMTHLHSDHMGSMRHFKSAQFLVADRARTGHTGALMCRIPQGLAYRQVDMMNLQFGAFPQSVPVKEDGTIVIVPTSGHANGHQSVIVQAPGISICLAGDAAFSLDQILSGEIGGIVESVPDARDTARRLKRQYEAFGTIMLPTHDPANADRLAVFP